MSSAQPSSRLSFGATPREVSSSSLAHQPPQSGESLDFYAHAKHKLGTMCVDDSSMLCSPPASRPTKRNKVGTPKVLSGGGGASSKTPASKTPRSLASTVKTDDDDDEEMPELRMPGLGGSPTAKDLFAARKVFAVDRKPLEPRPANVNPFAPTQGLTRCESIDPNSFDASSGSYGQPQNGGVLPSPMLMPPPLPDRKKKKTKITTTRKGLFFPPSAMMMSQGQGQGQGGRRRSSFDSSEDDDDDFGGRSDDSFSLSTTTIIGTTTTTARGGGRPAAEIGGRPAPDFGSAQGPPLCPPETRRRSRFQEDFEVVKLIGGGSFGTVHKVKSRLDGVCYAVKATKAQFKGKAHRERMLAEVFALAALAADHEGAEGSRHVVRYYQAWIDDERLFIQTELCDSSLERELSRGRFERTPKSLWAFLRQLLLALDLIHTKGLVHLDIKPGNIFVNHHNKHAQPGAPSSFSKGGQQHQQPLYKLGDFGLVTKADRQSDVVEGDSRYMSKELLDDFDDDFADDFDDPSSSSFKGASSSSGGHRRRRDLTKCDLFSLGATAYELVQAQPLPANGPLWHALRDGPPSLTFSDSKVPAALDAVVRDMMRPQPADRPTADDLLKRVPELQSPLQQLALTVGQLEKEVKLLNSPGLKRLARSQTWCG